METYGLWARSDAYGKWAQVAFPGVSFAWKGPCTPINTSQLYFHNIITRVLLLSVLCICDFVVFITMSLQYFAEITFLFCNEIVLLFLFVLCLFVWLLHNNFSMFGWNIRYNNYLIKGYLEIVMLYYEKPCSRLNNIILEVLGNVRQ